MIPDQRIPELDSFRLAESTLPMATDPTLGSLVVANSNDTEPVHRWFRFKEAYSHSLLERVLADVAVNLSKKLTLLDPFCGTGTTLVASQQYASDGYEITAIGIERNPFIHFVARTKTRWRSVDVGLMSQISNDLLTQGLTQSPIPSLSSISQGVCISHHMARRIVSLRDAIKALGNDATHDALLLGLASAIEPVSKIRKDGRALRRVERKRALLDRVLRERWGVIAEDCRNWQAAEFRQVEPTIILGDGRRPLAHGVREDSVDLIITSPPYPNNIDYTEVYKLELWLLGFVKDSQSFYNMRHKTVRSHPIITAVRPTKDFKTALKTGTLRDLLGSVLERIGLSAENWRKQMLLGYFFDMWTALAEHKRVLKPGGYEIIVVGNSLHGSKESTPYVIPTDLIISEIARLQGFDVCKTIVARALKRRLTGNHFLRESLVVLQKPA